MKTKTPKQKAKAMKTANEIINQTKRIFSQLDKTTPDYSAKIHGIAEIGRRYLNNIARHYGKPYGSDTWKKIGNNPLPASIYMNHQPAGTATNMIQVRIHQILGITIFKVATMEQAKELQSKLYNAFAENGCWMPLSKIEIVNA